MEDLLRAISDRREVEFTYDGLPWVVRPAACGRHATTGRELLRGYQVDGLSHSNLLPAWELYSLAKIGDLVITARHFEVPDGYSRDDRNLGLIFGQL